jgi:hypothetical protein
MATALSRLGLPHAERGGADSGDAPDPDGRTDETASSDGLIAVNVQADDVGDYSVSEAGWYAVDDAGKVVMGPFVSLAECDRASRDRRKHAAPTVSS